MLLYSWVFKYNCCISLPNHKLKLKIGVPTILLRNIDQSYGLCNGTTHCNSNGQSCVGSKSYLWKQSMRKVFIPRLSFISSNPRISFKFQRKQFLVVISFAITIAKSQEQFLKNVWNLSSNISFLTWPIICYNVKSYNT